ncbi:MAG: hypothetical protein FWD25_12100 [Clostridia bacterium]|nr:hypothetical protein [Clostridia bacterium]
MEAIGAVLLLAVVVEALIQVIKGWLPTGASVVGWLWPVVGAIIGVALCLLADVDLLHLAGVDLKSPPIGMILTGLLISRGASFVHDIWANVNSR